jgi:hypothetical protein
VKTIKNCGVCGVEVVTEPDPLNTGTEGTAITMHSDVDGQPVAQWHHAACRASEVRRARGRAVATPEPAVTDWEAEIRAVLAEAEEKAA